MSKDLYNLFSSRPDTQTTIDEYYKAIIEENCLFKKSTSSRKLSFSHLKSLYDLDVSLNKFSFFRFLWDQSDICKELLCMQYSYLNDSVLRKSADYFLSMQLGDQITTETTFEWVQRTYPNRFSQATATTIAQDLNSSWFQSGFYEGNRIRTRIRTRSSCGNVVFAIYISYLQGYRGMQLFNNEYTKLLELSPEESLRQVDLAAKIGLIRMRRLGDVVEVHFPFFSQKED